MYFSKFVPVLGALIAGVQASPAPIAAPIVAASPKIVAGRADASSTKFDLSKTFDQATVYDGLAPSTNGAKADVDLHVSIPNAVINGDVGVQLGADFLVEPTLTIDLSGVQAYVELDIKADAEVYVSVELVTSDQLALNIPGLLDVDAGLALALDLVICLDAAIEVFAGLYINFPEGSFVKINLLDSTVIDHVLNDLVAKALPLSLGVELDLDAEVTLQVGLRLRTEIGIAADVDPLGIPLLSAGAEVAVWINLCDYTSVIIGNPSPNCTTGIQESLSLDVGVIVDLDVDVLNVIDLALAPTVSVTLAAAPSSTSCVADCACTSGLSSGLPSSTSPATASASVTSAPAASVTVPAASSYGNGTIPTGPATSTASSVTSTGNGGSSASTATAGPSSSGNGSGASSTGGNGSGASSTGGNGSGASSTGGNGSGASSTGGNGSGASSTGGNGNGASPTTSAAAGVTKAPKPSMTTSTFYETTTQTITSCAASVVNCPASFTQKVVTEIVYAKTTVCPIAGATSAVHWSGNATSTFVIPTASLTSGTATYTTYPATSAPANTFTAPTSITPVAPTITLTGVPTTVTPVAATTVAPTVPAGGVVGSSVPLTPATLVTASSYKPTGPAPTATQPVTAGAAKVVSHAGAFMALAAGLMLAF